MHFGKIEYKEEKKKRNYTNSNIEIRSCSVFTKNNILPNIQKTIFLRIVTNIRFISVKMKKKK